MKKSYFVSCTFMKHYSHLNTAETVLKQYRGTQPFGLFIKEFFKVDKKYGSRDRRRITALCYACFRLGRIQEDADFKERILLGLFLTSTVQDELLEMEKPEWNANVILSVREKIMLAGLAYSPDDHFPAIAHLSGSVDQEKFTLSHFVQPDLFLRLRPGHENKVKSKLQDAGISFKEIAAGSLALPNASKLDEVILINREAVIQDYSSQRVIGLINSEPGFAPQKVWDCCAASGGKSLLVYDHFPTIRLTVSDVRENIMANLTRRFREAGINSYKGFVADLGKPVSSAESYDLIMADVPCTGSGTWGRTPEQLVFFQAEKISDYTKRQRLIIANTWQHLKPGGYFLYITCSVYKEENEGAVEFIEKQTPLKLIRSSLIQGYSQHADTLFAALFRYEKSLEDQL